MIDVVDTTMEKVYSTREIAQHLGVSLDWVRKTFGGRDDVFRLGGKYLRIPARALEAVMAEMRHQGNGSSTTAKNRSKRTRDSARA